jgi:hypothetical protein
MTADQLAGKFMSEERLQELVSFSVCNPPCAACKNTLEMASEIRGLKRILAVTEDSLSDSWNERVRLAAENRRLQAMVGLEVPEEACDGQEV